jgi:hypothetical protein
VEAIWKDGRMGEGDREKKDKVEGLRERYENEIPVRSKRISDDQPKERRGRSIGQARNEAETTVSLTTN